MCHDCVIASTPVTHDLFTIFNFNLILFNFVFTYQFYIRNNSKHILALRIRYKREKAELSMGVEVPPEILDGVSWEVRKPENAKWVAMLQEWRRELDDLRVSLIREKNTDIGIKEIARMAREELFGDSQTQKEPTEKKGTFAPFFEKHTANYEKRSTRESNSYTISVMKKFMASRNADYDALNFEDINYAWLSDFEIYMKEANMSQNTRKIHFGNIRTAMRDAYKRELTDADPFRRFAFRPAKTRKRSLNVVALRLLFNYPVEPFAEIYRDMMKLSFMLMGINTIDLYNLKAIRSGRIEYDRSKTGGLFSIKVEPEAKEIVKKYKGEKNLLCLADRWSDYRNFRHQLNDAVKRFGKAQGKGKKDKKSNGPFAEVTSYWMRHTWATIASDLDIPDATISLALGHAGGENRTTNIYIRRNQKKVDEANRKVLDYVLYGKR